MMAKEQFDAEAENQKYTKPCPYDPQVPCVQMPEENPCDCDWCAECEIKRHSKAAKIAKCEHRCSIGMVITSGVCEVLDVECWTNQPFPKGCLIEKDFENMADRILREASRGGG